MLKNKKVLAIMALVMAISMLLLIGCKKEEEATKLGHQMQEPCITLLQKMILLLVSTMAR